MKRCIKCKEARPDYQFSLRRKGGTARRGECKFCHAARERLRKAGKVTKKPVLEPTDARKICTGCGEEKDLIFFDKNAGGRQGLHSKCKQCRSAQNAAYILSQSQEERGQQEWYNPQALPIREMVLQPPVIQPEQR